MVLEAEVEVVIEIQVDKLEVVVELVFMVKELMVKELLVVLWQKEAQDEQMVIIHEVLTVVEELYLVVVVVEPVV